MKVTKNSEAQHYHREGMTMTAKTKIKIGTLLSGLALLFSEGGAQASVTLYSPIAGDSPAARCTSADYYHPYPYTVDGRSLAPGQTGTSVDVRIDHTLMGLFPELPQKDCDPCVYGYGMPCVQVCDVPSALIRIIPELRYWDSTRTPPDWVHAAWGDYYEAYTYSYAFSNLSHPGSLGSTYLGTLGTVLGGTQFAPRFYRFLVNPNYYNVRIWFQRQYVYSGWSKWSPVSVPLYFNGTPLENDGTPAGYCDFAR